MREISGRWGFVVNWAWRAEGAMRFGETPGKWCWKKDRMEASSEWVER